MSAFKNADDIGFSQRNDWFGRIAEQFFQAASRRTHKQLLLLSLRLSIWLWSYFILGGIYAMIKNFNQAIFDLTKAIQFDSNNIYAY